MSTGAGYFYEEELEEPGEFVVRNVPDTPWLHIRLLHHKSTEGGDRIVDVLIEPDEPDGRKVSVSRGQSQFERGVRIEIRG